MQWEIPNSTGPIQPAAGCAAPRCRYPPPPPLHCAFRSGLQQLSRTRLPVHRSAPSAFPPWRPGRQSGPSWVDAPAPVPPSAPSSRESRRPPVARANPRISASGPPVNAAASASAIHSCRRRIAIVARNPIGNSNGAQRQNPGITKLTANTNGTATSAPRNCWACPRRI